MPTSHLPTTPLTSPPRPLAPMKQIFALVALVLALGVAAIAGTGLMLSNHWQVTTEVLVAAPPARIYPLLEDFKRWPEWEAVKHDDPTVRYTYTGAPSGVGAVRQFAGKRDKAGTTTITQSVPAEGVWFESSLSDGSGKASASITFHVDHEITKVVWTDSGTLPRITGAFLRDSVEQRLQYHMQESLKRLKQRVEGATVATP